VANFVAERYVIDPSGQMSLRMTDLLGAYQA
jgi:hypothetical protein